jgi:hypothetical protein
MGCVFPLNRNMNTFYWNKWNKKRCPNVYVSTPDSNTLYVYLLFMLFRKNYAQYSISKTILKNFYHSNQIYKYNATDKVWENLLIEPAFKHCIFKKLHELACVVYNFWIGIWIHFNERNETKKRYSNVCDSAPDSNTNKI